MKRLLALLTLLACGKSAPPPPPPPPPAPACTDATPCALNSAAPSHQGMIAAPGQIDVYTVEVPQARAGLRTIIQVQVSNSAQATPVKLVYTLESPDGLTVLATRGPARGNRPQFLTGNFLVTSPGLYRVVVRDVLSQAADGHNGYSILTALFDDPDAAIEPDDTLDKARPIAFGTTPASMSGSVAYTGDKDALVFTVPAPGAIAHLTVSQAALADSPLKLRVRLLAGAALSSVLDLSAGADRTRFLPAGNYALIADDATGEGGDARPQAAWTVTLQKLADPDPNEQTNRNDEPATATLVPNNGSPVQGAIGSQGDRDWYRIELPASSTMKVVELSLNPQQANDDLELNWTVAEPIAQPTVVCDLCESKLLCLQDKCAFDTHAQHHFLRGESTPSTVRIRHIGNARALYVAVNDQGDLRFSGKLYSVSARLLDDPDVHELDGGNDTLETSTPLSGIDAGSAVTYSATGQISNWDYIDGRTTAATRADVDWYALPLPPRELGEPDGGCLLDAGLPDGGCPLVPQPRPAYGVAVHWKDPSDGVYRLGLLGMMPTPDGGLACQFTLDHQLAHATDAGGFTYGDGKDDLCFCLPAANAEGDKLWLRVEAAHRPQAPGPNASSDLPYSVQLDLTPRALQAKCDGGCPAVLDSRSCPGH